MAAKNTIEPFRAKDIDPVALDTAYYNAEIHQASLAEPQFFKQMIKTLE
jgi:spermidine synthase